MDTLSKRLREERERAKLTQQELAKKAGCGQSLIGNLESGAQKSSAKIPLIAAALGVSALYLSEGKGQKELDNLDQPRLSAQESSATYRTEPASRAERVADKVADLPDDDPLLDYLEDMLAGRWARQGGGGGWVKKALADRDRREDKLKLKKSRGAA